MLFGAAWAFIPGYLQAKRGSHVVITTIMFNFIASALMVYLLVNVLKPAGQHEPGNRAVPARTPSCRCCTTCGCPSASISNVSRLNISFLIALVAAVARLGADLEDAARLRDPHGRPQPRRRRLCRHLAGSAITIIAMLLSGGLAGLMAINVLMGDQQRLVLDYTAGAGFVGIAVALMGRSHPFGIVLASILFGALYQGGAELAFEKPDHQPRHDRRHPGHGDPVRRRARADVQAAARRALRGARPPAGVGVPA